jgi:2-polyprenyl-6-methoxyphenol hydroxylase-like FAD-dependent oxidoreductase
MRVAGSSATFRDSRNQPSGRQACVQSRAYRSQLNTHRHGYAGLLFDRQKYLRVLVETLPEWETRVKTNKRVIGIEPTATGVTVQLEDGTSETGSIVIGADGLWSIVRQEMERIAGEQVFDPEYTGFSGIYGHGGAVAGLDIGNAYERHDDSSGMAMQVFTAPGKTFWGCYTRMEDGSGRERKYRRFSDAEADELAEKWLDMPIYGKTTFGDIWRAREVWGMTQLHAGSASKWHHGRMVLLGDAVAKVSDCDPPSWAVLTASSVHR